MKAIARLCATFMRCDMIPQGSIFRNHSLIRSSNSLLVSVFVDKDNNWRKTKICDQFSKYNIIGPDIIQHRYNSN